MTGLPAGPAQPCMMGPQALESEAALKPCVGDDSLSAGAADAPAVAGFAPPPRHRLQEDHPPPEAAALERARARVAARAPAPDPAAAGPPPGFEEARARSEAGVDKARAAFEAEKARQKAALERARALKGQSAAPSAPPARRGAAQVEQAFRDYEERRRATLERARQRARNWEQGQQEPTASEPPRASAPPEAPPEPEAEREDRPATAADGEAAEVADACRATGAGADDLRQRGLRATDEPGHSSASTGASEEAFEVVGKCDGAAEGEGARCGGPPGADEPGAPCDASQPPAAAAGRGEAAGAFEDAAGEEDGARYIIGPYVVDEPDASAGAEEAAAGRGEAAEAFEDAAGEEEGARYIVGPYVVDEPDAPAGAEEASADCGKAAEARWAVIDEVAWCGTRSLHAPDCSGAAEEPREAAAGCRGAEVLRAAPRGQHPRDEAARSAEEPSTPAAAEEAREAATPRAGPAEPRPGAAEAEGLQREGARAAAPPEASADDVPEAGAEHGGTPAAAESDDDEEERLESQAAESVEDEEEEEEEEEKEEEEEEEEDDDAAELSDGGEDLSAGSAKEPFPGRLQAARLALDCARGDGGAREAAARLDLAGILLEGGQYSQAKRYAEEAWTLADEGKEDDEQAAGEARAERLIVRAHLAEEESAAALEMAQEQLAHFHRCDRRMAQAIMSLALADVHTEMDRPKEAVRTAIEALATFRDLGDNELAAAALLSASQAGIKLGDAHSLKEALRRAEDALSFFQVVGDPKQEASTLLVIAKIHLQRLDIEEAVQKVDAAVKLSRDNNFKETEAAGLRELAAVALREDRELSLQLACEARELSDEAGDPLGEMAARHLLCGVQLSHGRREDALHTMEVALALARRLRDRRQVGQALDALLQMRADAGEMDEALGLLKREAKLAKRSGDARRHLAALQKLANTHLAMGAAEEATAVAERAVKIFTADGEARLQAWALQLLAEVWSATGRSTEALAGIARARALLVEEGEIRSVADTWQTAFLIHAELGDAGAALEARRSQRGAYGGAGWRHEEALALLALAEAQGGRDAVKTAREAVQIYQDDQDRAGEAGALLALAQLQVACKQNTEALASVKGARRIFQALGDKSGEARSMQTAGGIYLSNGSVDEALKLIGEGRAICQSDGDRQGEMDALQEILRVRVDVVVKEEESGRRPRPQAVQDACACAAELAGLLQRLGDRVGQVSALIQVSALQRVGECGDAALEAAEEALHISVELDRAQEVGMSLVALAEAHLFMEHAQQALDAAEQAERLAGETGDEAAAEAAALLAQSARSLKEAPPRAASSAAAGAAAAGAATASRPPRDPPPPRQAADAAPPGRPGEGGPAAARAHWLDAMRSAPDQEKRRRQLLMAATARAKPACCSAVGSLREELQAAVPRWGPAELDSTEEKLRHIEIINADDLFEQLRTEGIQRLNQRLKDVGQKALRQETWEGLLDRANKLEMEVLD